MQTRLHRIAYLRLLGRPYTLLYVKRSVGRLEVCQVGLSRPWILDYSKILRFKLHRRKVNKYILNTEEITKENILALVQSLQHPCKTQKPVQHELTEL